MFCSQEIENITSKVDNHNKIKEYGCCLNVELNSSSEEILYRKYITCLKKYQLAIKFADMLSSTYQIFQLIILLLIAICVSILGIRMIDVLDRIGEMIKFMSLVGITLTYLLIICYSGQRIMDESQDIFYRAYAMEWYNVSPRIKTLLLITLYRSSTPCKLMAGNTFILSMMTFAAVVRLTMSYFTAFLSLRD